MCVNLRTVGKKNTGLSLKGKNKVIYPELSVLRLLVCILIPVILHDSKKKCYLSLLGLHEILTEDLNHCHYDPYGSLLLPPTPQLQKMRMHPTFWENSTISQNNPYQNRKSYLEQESM